MSFLKLSKELIHKVIEIIVMIFDSIFDLFNTKDEKGGVN